MVSQLSRVSVSLVVALLLTFAAVGMAAAFTWSSGCPSGGRVCLWRDVGFSGPNGNWIGSNASYVGEFFPGGHAVNNNASSLRNNYGTQDILVYDDVNYGFGGVGAMCVDSGQQIDNLWFWTFHNDKISSHQVFGHDGMC